MDVNINPLSKAIGAEILGVDLSEKVDSEDLFHINLAMQKSLVLVFRNQNWSQIIFCRLFVYLATPWSNTSLIL